MAIFPLAPDQTIAQMWSNGVRGGPLTGTFVIVYGDIGSELAYLLVHKEMTFKYTKIKINWVLLPSALAIREHISDCVNKSSQRNESCPATDVQDSSRQHRYTYNTIKHRVVRLFKQ